MQLLWAFLIALRRILRLDLQCHHYKIVQELHERDLVSRQNACEALLENLPDAVVVFSDEAYFHISGCVNKQNKCVIDVSTIHVSFIRR